MAIHRKKTRLPKQNYVGQRAYFITICCDSRRSYLTDPKIASRVIVLLHECAASQSFVVHAYCAMPDHLHLLVEGSAPRANLVNFVRIFKQRTAFEFKQSNDVQLWEMNFYDHILRRQDAVEDVASYIWWNPVRKKLCAVPSEFPFSGSNTIPWMKRCANPPNWSVPWKAGIV